MRAILSSIVLLASLATAEEHLKKLKKGGNGLIKRETCTIPGGTCSDCFGEGNVLCDYDSCYNPSDGEQCCLGGTYCVGDTPACCDYGPGMSIGTDGVIVPSYSLSIPDISIPSFSYYYTDYSYPESIEATSTFDLGGGASSAAFPSETGNGVPTAPGGGDSETTTRTSTYTRQVSVGGAGSSQTTDADAAGQTTATLFDNAAITKAPVGPMAAALAVGMAGLAAL